MNATHDERPTTATTDGLAADLVATATTAAEHQTATVGTLPVPVADLVTLATRAADRAARTYRLAKLGVDAADVVADVLADVLADLAAGTLPTVADQDGRTDRDRLAAMLATRARRVADRYRREAARLVPAGTAAETVDGATATSDQDLGAVDRRQRAAVMGRRPRTLAADRSDVLAVGDWSREIMRSAETQAVGARDRAAVVAAVDAPYVPTTAAQRAAWHELADQHGQDAPTVAVLVGRARVARVLVDACPWPTRSERADLRTAERATAEVLAALPVDAPERPDAVRAARLARETRDAALAHGGRPARVAVDVVPVVEYRPRPAATAADVLAAGYRPEILADNTSTNRRRGEVDHYRAMSWAAVLPTSSETARVQVAKAARTWAADVLGRPVGTGTVPGTSAVLPVLPAVARGELLPSCQTCQDRGHGHHGQTSYTRTAATVGPRAARVRAGGAAARAADQDGRATRARARVADVLAAATVADV